MPEGEYITQPERERRARARDAQALLQRASTFPVPDEYSLEHLKVHAPEVYQYLVSGESMAADKRHPQLAKAIWYNELDRKHTFNTGFKVAGANFSLAIMALHSNKDVENNHDIDPKLLVPYAIACHERRFTPDAFIDRNNFLDLWLASSDDVHFFSQGDVKRINKITGDMKQAVAELQGDGTGRYDDLTSKLREVIYNDIEPEALTDEGEKLFAQTYAADKEMNTEDRAFTIYQGENSIEEGLSSRSDQYRLAKRREYFEKVFGAMEQQMDELKRMGDTRRYDEFANKVLRVTEVHFLRCIADRMGFEGFWEAVQQ